MRALITGITGQDGAYLAELLLQKGYNVIGGCKRSSTPSTGRLEELGVADAVKMVPLDLLELTNLIQVIDEERPDEVYNLGAQSFVGLSFTQPLLTSEIDAMGVLRMLEAIRVVKPDTRFYQASTSEMFGRVQEVPQTETTPFHPRSPYGVAKLFGHWATVNYREAHNLFACSGILFNHESPLRGAEFVTRKISRAVARIRAGLQDRLALGNLDAKRDWGHAREYVGVMWRMLQHDVADDYVIATGETHTVREFVEAAFATIDMEISWSGEGVEEIGVDRVTGRTVVEIDPQYFRPAEVELLLGDPSKARRVLGWQPEIRFEQLVQEMVDADLRRVDRVGAV